MSNANENARKRNTVKRLATEASVAVQTRKDRDAVARHSERFRLDYETNIQTILTLPSGQHPINPDKLNEWIMTQQSQTRRDAAAALSQHITYITHQEVIDRCRDLVTQFYTNYLPQQGLQTPTIALFTHRRGKSGYMIALLFYYWVQQLGYQVPTIMIGELYPHLLKDPNCVTAYVDDMSYSGSQLAQILSKYAILPSFIEKTGYPKVWVGFVAMTEKAQQMIQTIHPFEQIFASYNFAKNVVDKNPNIVQYNIREPQYRGKTMKHMKMQNPFTVYVSRMIPSLRKQMGDKMYVTASVFFNPHEADCIVYFDHKIADSPSTFMKVLVFGPVPAVDATFPSEQFNDGAYSYWSSDRTLPDIPIHDSGKDGHTKITQFKPFIDGCPEFSEEIKSSWGKVPYADFLSGQKMSDVPLPVPLSTFDDTDIRCPSSWYKRMFADANKGGSRNKKRKTRKTTRY